MCGGEWRRGEVEESECKGFEIIGFVRVVYSKEVMCWDVGCGLESGRR